MLIENQTRNTVVASGALFAKDFITKSIGLISHATPVPLVFKTQLGIHTFFMRYEIDVMLLDESNYIRDICPYLKPNRLYVWGFFTRTVIELPAGRINETKSRIGDEVAFM